MKNKKQNYRKLLVMMITMAFTLSTKAQVITTVAGSTSMVTFGGDGGQATAAQLHNPYGVAIDGSGNMFIADDDNNRIRKVSASGIISTFAGGGTSGLGDGGPATAAELGYPQAVFVDGSGNVYIADDYNQRIRKVNASGIISTYVGTGTSGYSGDGGPATAAEIMDPQGVVADGSGNVYISDFSGVVRKVDASGIITTFAGGGTSGLGDGGPATAAELELPAGVAIDGSGNVYIADESNNRIRKVNTSGIISTVAGNGYISGGTAPFFYGGYSGDGGPATAAELNDPTGIAVDGSGNLYIGDFTNNRIRKVNTSGIISTYAGNGTTMFAGDGSPATAAGLNATGIAVDGCGNLYIADGGNNRIREVSTVLPVTAVSVTVCPGAAITFADATTGGAWSSSNTSIAMVAGAGIITGVAAGTARITYTTGTGCASKAVTVLSSPPAITGTTHMCAGAATTLSDAGGMGAWSSSNTAFATVTSMGNVSGVAAGSAAITFTSGPTGCTAITTVTVNSVPGAVTGATGVCTGATATLSDGGGGTWSSGNIAEATIDSATGAVTGIAAGHPPIIYTLPGGCNTEIMFDVISSPPVITGTTHMCAGAATTLSDAGGMGAWSSSNTAFATVTPMGNVSGVAAGSPSITFTSGPTGCIAIITVTVNPVPGAITGAASVCTGATATLSDGGGGGGTWSSGNTAEATIDATTGMITGIAAGAPPIIYTLPGGCNTEIMFDVISSPPAITGTTHMCAGAATALTDAGSGAWSSSNTALAAVGSGTGVVTGVAGGSVAITYTLASTGCTAVTTVTVNPLPGAITGTTSLCAAAVTALSDAGGGTWNCGSPGLATVDAATGAVTGVAAGNPVITYILPTGCTTAITITVDPLPGAITGATNVCIAAATTLSDAGSGAWSSSNAALATIGSGTGVVTGVTAGSATITYTLAPTGCTAVTTITVDPLPVFSSSLTPPEICDTTVFSYIPASTPAAVYAWTRTAVPGISNGTASGTGNPGELLTNTTIAPVAVTYTYTSTTAAGCTATAFVIVTVDPLPSAGVITGTGYVCTGNTITLADAASGGAWSSSNNSFATVDGAGLVTGITGGLDVILYTFTNTCGSAQAVFHVTVYAAGNCPTYVQAAPVITASVNVYPNPNDGAFTLLISSATDEQVTVTITNITGQKVQELSTVTNKPAELKLTQPAGIYFLSAATANEIHNTKIILQ